ncbi:hypothetical protein A1D29_05980 [Pasteurellaceae bacterium Orientalotternb1]|nr:hypothetical protein A1D29_05980 [Pasteurellaceae bacterium Orientalotternb1]
MKKLFLATALSLVLTACGGGGSGGGNSSSNSNNVTPPSTGQKSIDLVSEELKSQMRALKKITLDNGTVLDVAEMPVGYLEQNIDTGKVKGINGVYYAFGTWVPYNLTYNEHGLPTNHSLYNQQRAVAYITQKADLPKSGIAVYEGQSLGAATRGKLRLEVDFSKQTSITGKIYDRRLDDGRSLADINLKRGYIVTFSEGGSGFRGDADYRGVNGQFDGNFVGPKAEEVMGRVTRNGAVYVGFGGKRGELIGVQPSVEMPKIDTPTNTKPEIPNVTGIEKSPKEIVDEINKQFLESPLTKEMLNSLLN